MCAFLFIPIQPVLAQEEEPHGPVYVVQPGDTLSSIAYKFNIPLNSIIIANGLPNPDNIAVGIALVLPGVDWVSGTINSQAMALGENYRSIARRYKIESEVFSRLSGIVSPEQLAAGYPILIASDGSEDLNYGRIAVNNSLSILETALMANVTPWALVSENLLNGTWDLENGDILFVPGTNDPGPGAFPSPISQFEYDGDRLVQGRTAVLRISAGGANLNLGGEFMQQELHFFDSGGGNYIALQGVHVMSEPGFYPILISGIMPDGSSFKYSQLVTVVGGGYDFETITVDDSYLDPELSASETDYVWQFVKDAGAERMWEGYFTPPSPYGDVINSYFGTRRSFNQSGFEYFHSGVDFGGGTGVEIFSPANGVVVLAEALDICGITTVIDHGWGVYSRFCHQSEIFVSEGQEVRIGQTVGLVGNTGRSSGAHLHWELIVGGIQVDPLEWLSKLFP